MQQQQEDAGVWPAYVAAVAGLVQSLLFLAAVMALVLLQLGMLAGRKIDDARARSMAERSETEKDSGRDLMGVPEPGSTGASQSKISKARMTPSEMDNGLKVHFKDAAVLLSDEARQHTLNALTRQLQAGHAAWVLTVTTDTEDVTLRRAAYLRLLVVRNVLLEAGASPEQVQTRLLTAPVGVPVEMSQTVFVLPQDPQRIGVKESR